MPFLKIPVGARAEAMGGAYVAIANDPYALYWNPAGVAQIENRWIGDHAYDTDRRENGGGPKTRREKLFAGSHAFAATRINWIADVTYDYVSLVTPLPNRLGHIGISLGSLSTPDMEITTTYQPEGTGEYFSFGDFLAGLTYGLQMTKNFSWGVTLKYAREDLAGHTMTNMMLDLGTYYWTGFRDLRLGVALVHFGPNAAPDGSYTYTDDAGEEVTRSFQAYAPPTEFRLGTAMTVYASGYHRVLMSAQLNHPVDNAENFKLGAEYAFFDMLFIRGGLKLNTDEDHWSTGGGVRVPFRGIAFSADYSYTDFGLLDAAHRISIGITY
ncbi:PorV/PorQ family protein [bacterium]|nr:PorV/PorQ family protein [bacterium]